MCPVRGWPADTDTPDTGRGRCQYTVTICIFPLAPQAAVTSVPSRIPFPDVTLSAGLLAASFPLADTGVLSGPLGWCAMLAYIPLFVWMGESRRSVPPGRVFAVALLVHVLAYSAAFHWVLFHPNSTTVAASIGGVLTLALLASTPLAVAVWTARRVGPHWLLPIWAVSTLGLEHVLSLGPWALPWPVLSMSQAALPHAGLARWIGAPGLTALVLLTNATGAAWLISRRQRSRSLNRTEKDISSRQSGVSENSEHLIHASPRRVYSLAIALGLTVLIAPVVAPLPHSQPTAFDEPQPQLLIVQPGMSSETWARMDTTETIDQLIRQTKAALHEASQTNDIGSRMNDGSASDSTGQTESSGLGRNDKTRLAAIVWPETAISGSLFAITDYHRLHAFILTLPAPLLTGAVLGGSRGAAGSDASPSYQNVALWLDAHTLTRDPAPNTNLGRQLDRTAVYAKHHLVPFAEQVPFAGTVPALQKFAVPSGVAPGPSGIAGYAPGAGPTTFPPLSADATPAIQKRKTTGHRDRPPLRIAPLICFETIIGPYARAASVPDHPASKRAPTVLVALAHVGWWGRSSVLPQYRALTSLRSVETGLPIVVATVRGPSFTTKPDGSVHVHTRWMQNTTALASIPEASPAPFSLWAEWIHVGIAVLLIVGCRYLSETIRRVSA